MEFLFFSISLENQINVKYLDIFIAILSTHTQTN